MDDARIAQLRDEVLAQLRRVGRPGRAAPTSRRGSPLWRPRWRSCSRTGPRGRAPPPGAPAAAAHPSLQVLGVAAAGPPLRDGAGQAVRPEPRLPHLRPLTPGDLAGARGDGRSRVIASRTILHVDMDAFYAAVEQRDRPELQGQARHRGRRPARAARARAWSPPRPTRRAASASAAPCPSRRPGGPARRASTSPRTWRSTPRSRDQVMEVLRRFTDCVEPVSIDEAFLDVTGSRRALGAVAARTSRARLKAAIARETAPHGLGRAWPPRSWWPRSPRTCASRTAWWWCRRARRRRSWPRCPCAACGAWGPKMEEALARLGVHTIGELAALRARPASSGGWARTATTCAGSRGASTTARSCANAEDAKSIGQEHTFDADTADLRRLRRTLLDLADAVARRLREPRRAGAHRDPQVPRRDFRTLTRAETLPERHAIPETCCSRRPGGSSRACTAGGGSGCWGSTPRASRAGADGLFAPPRASPPTPCAMPVERALRRGRAHAGQPAAVHPGRTPSRPAGQPAPAALGPLRSLRGCAPRAVLPSRRRLGAHTRLRARRRLVLSADARVACGRVFSASARPCAGSSPLARACASSRSPACGGRASFLDAHTPSARDGLPGGGGHGARGRPHRGARPCARPSPTPEATLLAAGADDRGATACPARPDAHPPAPDVTVPTDALVVRC